MENNQLLPFERNRYYVGKLLTSADFQAEQTYNNHKRRFLNEMMLAAPTMSSFAGIGCPPPGRFTRCWRFMTGNAPAKC